MVTAEIPESKRESQGRASLQMAMGYVSSLSNQYDVLDSKTALLMGAQIVTLSATAGVVAASDMSGFLLIAPAVIVLISVSVGMYVLRPREVLEFIAPSTLIEKYRYGGFEDDAIAWVLVESVQDSVERYEKLIKLKKDGVLAIQLLFAALILIVVASVLCAVLA